MAMFENPGDYLDPSEVPDLGHFNVGTPQRMKPWVSGPNLTDYDYIVVNTSGGKDSQVMMDYVCRAALKAGVLNRVVAVHADLGRFEWSGVKKLAEEQAKIYGLPFYVVAHERDLIEAMFYKLKSARAQGKKNPTWPGPGQLRWCTSEHKTAQVSQFLTQLIEETGKREGFNPNAKYPKRRIVKFLNCLGLRAQESDERANRPPFSRPVSNLSRIVDEWLPIHKLTKDDVWKHIAETRVPHHFAYRLGMPRLSCVFCFYAQKWALTLAAHHNKQLLEEYLEAERKSGFYYLPGGGENSLSTIKKMMQTTTPEQAARMAIEEEERASKKRPKCV